MTRVMRVVNKVQQYWADHPTDGTLRGCMKATGCSRPTASKYRPRGTGVAEDHDDAVAGGSRNAAPQATAASPAANVDPPQQKAVDPAGGHDFDAMYPSKEATQQGRREPPTPSPAPVKPAPVAEGNATPPQQEGREPPKPRRRNWELRL